MGSINGLTGGVTVYINAVGTGGGSGGGVPYVGATAGVNLESQGLTASSVSSNNFFGGNFSGGVFTGDGSGLYGVTASATGTGVPYSGATGNLNLGIFSLSATNVTASVVSAGVLLNGNFQTSTAALQTQIGSLWNSKVPYQGATASVDLTQYGLTAASVSALNVTGGVVSAGVLLNGNFQTATATLQNQIGLLWNAKVPYTGATANLNLASYSLTSTTISANSITARGSISAVVALSAGRVQAQGVSAEGVSALNIRMTTLSGETASAGAGYITTLKVENLQDRTGNTVLELRTNTISAIADYMEADGKIMSSKTFTSGIFGQGWRMDFNNTIGNQSFLELDNMRIRGSLRAHIFQKDIVRASNGFLLITDATTLINPINAVVTSITAKENVFQAADICWIKDIIDTSTPSASGSLTINSEYMLIGAAPVVTAASGYVYSVTRAYGGGGIAQAFPGNSTIVRIGSTGALSGGRTGVIMLDASSENSPFMDVIDSATSVAGITPTQNPYLQMTNSVIKTRIGRLSGINSGIWGNLPNVFGLWGQGVYLEGNIAAQSGYIGTPAQGWGINLSAITSSKITIASNSNSGFIGIGTNVNAFGKAGLFFGLSGSTQKPAFSASADSNNYLLWDGDKLSWKAANAQLDSGGNLFISGAITALSGTIGAWKIGTQALSSVNDKILLDSTNERLTISTYPAFGKGFASISGTFLGSNCASFVSNNINNLNYLLWNGAQLAWRSVNSELDYSGNMKLSGSISAISGTIGGWTIGPTTLSSSNGSIILDQSQNEITISTQPAFSKQYAAVSGTFLGSNCASMVNNAGSQYFLWNGQQLAWKSVNSELDPSGNMQLSGSISAVSGLIAGWTISGNRITKNGFGIDSSSRQLFTNISGQRIILDGSSNNFQFFKTGYTTSSIQVDDNIIGSQAGIRFGSGEPNDSGLLYFYNTLTAGTVKSIYISGVNTPDPLRGGGTVIGVHHDQWRSVDRVIAFMDQAGTNAKDSATSISFYAAPGEAAGGIVGIGTLSIGLYTNPADPYAGQSYSIYNAKPSAPIFSNGGIGLGYGGDVLWTGLIIPEASLYATGSISAGNISGNHARVRSIQIDADACIGSRIYFRTADADGGSFVVFGLSAAGGGKNFEFYDYGGQGPLTRIFSADKGMQVYGTVTAAAVSSQAGVSGITGTFSSIGIRQPNPRASLDVLGRGSFSGSLSASNMRRVIYSSAIEQDTNTDGSVTERIWQQSTSADYATKIIFYPMLLNGDRTLRISWQQEMSGAVATPPGSVCAVLFSATSTTDTSLSTIASSIIQTTWTNDGMEFDIGQIAPKPSISSNVDGLLGVKIMLRGGAAGGTSRTAYIRRVSAEMCTYTMPGGGGGGGGGPD